MGRLLTISSLGISSLLFAACSGDISDGGQSVLRTDEGLSGCQGKASSNIPGDGNYFLTTFGDSPGDDGMMSCGDLTQHGSWYYAASRQRYGCGSKIQVEANGHCVVAQTDDYGPDVCVENAAGGDILDASPLVAKALFGVSGAGWSDHLRVHVTKVAATTPIGPCAASPPPQQMQNPPPQQMQNPPQHQSGDCHSGTLDMDVPTGTCVQSVSDAHWYQCQSGSWIAGESNCTTKYPWCYSHTLGKSVAARTCVQSSSNREWYQCDASGWDQPVANGAGPLGTCSAEFSL